MPINSENIRKKEFHIVFKGYKPEEVDKFLDLLSIEFERLAQRNKELQEYTDRLKYERSGESDEMKKVLQDALVSAHKVAEDIKRKAEMEAKEMYSQKKIESEKEFKELQLKKQKLEEDIANIKKQYMGLKQYLEESLKNMEGFEISEGVKAEPEESVQMTEESGQEESNPEAEEPEQGRQESSEELEAKEPEETEEAKEPETEEEKEEIEEEKEEKDFTMDRKRKNIDIANPDIIDDFFKTDEQ
ncbi:MAG: DivIVA domain-containing protein [Actinomycetota bacterium]